MTTYKVRYKLYKRSRQTYITSVKADNSFDAVKAVALRIWNYPFHLISVFEAGDQRAQEAALA